MNPMKVYQVLQASGFNKENAESLVNAFNENCDYATKKDIESLRNDIKDSEIRVLKELNSQTWKFLGGLALLGVVFKLAELFIKPS